MTVEEMQAPLQLGDTFMNSRFTSGMWLAMILFVDDAPDADDKLQVTWLDVFNGTFGRRQAPAPVSTRIIRARLPWPGKRGDFAGSEVELLKL